MRLIVPRELTMAELKAAARVTRGRWYLMRRIVGDAHGYAFLYAGVIGLGVMLFIPAQRSKDVFFGMIACLALGGLLLALTELLRRYRLRKALRRLNANPGSAILDEAGISFEGGAQPVHFKWEFFRKASVADRVAILYLPGKKKKYLIVPLTQLTSDDRADIAGVLRHVLGPAKLQIVPHK